ncbi:MAG: superoxide dismutase [Anaerolineae bacterium]
MTILSRRGFLRQSALLAAAVTASSLLPSFGSLKARAQGSGTAALPPLPYAFDALEPYIDAQTMEIHHDKHHAAYVNNLNNALEKYPDWQGKTAEELIADLTAVPEEIRNVVRNNAGGHVNHSLFWLLMSPTGGGEPQGELATAISSAFTDFATFKETLGKAATGRFGSGWAWLLLDKDGTLKIASTPNQDSPISEGQTPLLGIDVWEHAYYLKYQNRRADYVTAWWNVVNWQEVSNRFLAAKK